MLLLSVHYIKENEINYKVFLYYWQRFQKVMFNMDILKVKSLDRTSYIFTYRADSFIGRVPLLFYVRDAGVHCAHSAISKLRTLA